jgi:KaiC/GvpD/RAD55 family RecA-like ATPase
MKKQISPLLMIYAAVYMLLMLFSYCLLSSCTSTKKSVKQFTEAVEKTGFISSDTSSKSSVDSSSSTSSITSTKNSVDSNYEKITEETIIDWIVADPEYNDSAAFYKMVKRQTKRTIKEKGTSKKEQQQQQQTTTASSIQRADTSSGTHAQGNHQAATIDKSESDKSKWKMFSGWWWIVIVLVAGSGGGYFLNQKYKWIKWILPKKNQNDS